MARLGVMGGTFDPIHHGHLFAASEVLHRLGLDEVVFVPTGQSWQKAHRAVASAEQRVMMTEAATASNPWFSVSRVDVDRPGPTYTVDTLRDLRAERPEVEELFFIVGADALSSIGSWHEPDRVLELARLVGVTRPGHPLAGAGGLPAERVSLLEIPALPISSSDVRSRVSTGAPIRYLVPDGVVRTITDRALYRDLDEL